MTDNADAFEELFMRYKNQVVSYATPLTKTQQSAEEICQEVFIKIYRKASTYNCSKKFKPWFWTIVRNTSYDFLRKKSELLYEDFTASDENSSNFEIEDIDEQVEAKLITQSEVKRLYEVIQKLKVDQREVLMLQVFSELNYKEISETTGKSVSSVKSLLFRARKSLIELLEKENE